MLLCYLEHVREQMREVHRHNQLLWQIRALFGTKEKPPVPPALIREIEKL
jgi:hypothetical protein